MIAHMVGRLHAGMAGIPADDSGDDGGCSGIVVCDHSEQPLRQ